MDEGVNRSLERWAVAVLARLGLEPRTVAQVADKGSVNFVFVVETGSDRWVIRTPKDGRSPDVFAAERWCASQAQSMKVPTPSIPFVGISEGRAYSVQAFVDGCRGNDMPQQGDLWSALGRHGARINRIEPTSDAPAGLFTRFGRQLASAWTAHLDYNFEQLHARDELVLRGILSREEQELVRSSVDRLRESPQRFGLSHGDLALRNLIVTDDAGPVLIDWGSASFGPVPWPDLLIIDRDRRREGASVQRMMKFATAGGTDIVAQWKTFTGFRLLHHVDLVRWAIERRPDRIADTVVGLREVLNDQTSPVGCTS